MNTFTGPADPTAEVHRLASSLFCASGWPALMAVSHCRTLGPGAVLRVLRDEQRRVEHSGAWGSWPRVGAKLRALADHPRDRRRSRPRPTSQGLTHGPHAG